MGRDRGRWCGEGFSFQANRGAEWPRRNPTSSVASSGPRSGSPSEAAIAAHASRSRCGGQATRRTGVAPGESGFGVSGTPKRHRPRLHGDIAWGSWRHRFGPPALRLQKSGDKRDCDTKRVRAWLAMVAMQHERCWSVSSPMSSPIATPARATRRLLTGDPCNPIAPCRRAVSAWYGASPFRFREPNVTTGILAGMPQRSTEAPTERVPARCGGDTNVGIIVED